MAVLSDTTTEFIPCDEGTWRGVCVDVTPIVKKETQYGPRDTFSLAFETDAPERENKNGKHSQCVWVTFSASLNEKSNFRKFLKQWRGRDLTESEREEFETELLIGLTAMLCISREENKNGDIVSRIAACMPYKGTDPLKPSGKFVRKKDKNRQQQSNQNAQKGEDASYRPAAHAPTDVPKGEPVDSTLAGADWRLVIVHVGNCAGMKLMDLDNEARDKLINNWLIPTYYNDSKPSADDKRLAAALEKAKEYVAKVQAELQQKQQKQELDY